MPCPGHFTPGNETWYPSYRMLGGPQGVWTGKVNLAPRIVQPVAHLELT